MRTLGRQLDLVHLIRAALSALGWGEVDGCRALGTAPTALADVERGAHHAGVDLARLFVDDERLAVDDRAGLALVVDAEDLVADLELPALGRGGQWLEELDGSLPVENSCRVELGHAGDRVALLHGVEVDHFLCGFLECYRLRQVSLGSAC